MTAEELIEPLWLLFNDKTQGGYVRAWCLRWLGQTSNPEWYDFFDTTLHDKEEDVYVRAAAAEVLTYYKDERSLASLLKALTYRKFEVRKGIIVALGEAWTSEAFTPQANNYSHEAQAYEVLAGLIPQCNKYLYGEITYALVQLNDPRIFELFDGFLKSRNFLLRLAVIHAFQLRIGYGSSYSIKRDARELALLMKGLDDRDYDIRISTIISLSERTADNDQLVEPLIGLLKAKPDKVAAMAAGTLRSIGDRRAIEPLLEALQHGGCKLRGAAVEGLAQFGEERAYQPILALTSHKDKELRAKVISHKINTSQ